MRVNRQRLLKSSSQYTVTLTSRTSPCSQAYRFKATIQFPYLFTYRTQHLVLYIFFCLQPRLRTDVGLLHSIMIVIYRPSSIINKCFWRKLTLWTKKETTELKKTLIAKQCFHRICTVRKTQEFSLRLHPENKARFVRQASRKHATVVQRTNSYVLPSDWQKQD